jgi:hypothetical protein
LRGADFRWAVDFVAPYAAVFFVFVVYPVGYALWMASKPSLYADLIADRSYLMAVVNTLLFVDLRVSLDRAATGQSAQRRLSRRQTKRPAPEWNRPSDRETYHDNS